jgi:hypothetical protein
LDEYAESKVNKQVLALFFIGRHNDEVLCDASLMHTSHLLLGGHDNLIGMLYMMSLKIGILL